MKFIPGSVYCLLPSSEKCQGSVTVYKSKPSFLDEFRFSLEFKVESMVFLNCSPENAAQQSKQTEVSHIESRFEKCRGCFISHFPSPNTSHCKWKKTKSNSKLWPVRLRGGARTDQTQSLVQRAILNGKAHGINLHAGVENHAQIAELAGQNAPLGKFHCFFFV